MEVSEAKEMLIQNRMGKKFFHAELEEARNIVREAERGGSIIRDKSR
ncbi:MAG: hypothetical protein V1847_00210 [Candidatus Diapherotrites archaeon]